jgi:ATP/maltotriose-dependent transcriptional regulator MalT
MSDVMNVMVANFSELFRRIDLMDATLARIANTSKEVQMAQDDIDAAVASLEGIVADTNGTVEKAIKLIDGLLDVVDNKAADPARVTLAVSRIRDMRERLAAAVAAAGEQQPGGPSLGPQPGPEPSGGPEHPEQPAA